MTLVSQLPKDFPAIVVVVLHVGHQPSILPELLTRAGPLPAVHARDRERPRPRRIYVAPPDHHLLLGPGAFRLSRGPRENHARPAIDPTFRTAALNWGSSVIGVVLTGHLDDGAAGLAAIKACGGIAVVQDPQEAVAPSMPASALTSVDVDHCVLLTAIAPLLVRLAAAPRPAGHGPAPVGVVVEQELFEGVQDPMEKLNTIATPTQLTCPQCGGTLSELNDTRPLRYRCHTGHAYTALTLDSAQSDQTEHALQSGFRALQEREALLRRMAAVSRSLGEDAQADAALQQAERVHEQSRRLAAMVEEERTTAEPGA